MTESPDPVLDRFYERLGWLTEQAGTTNDADREAVYETTRARLEAELAHLAGQLQAAHAPAAVDEMFERWCQHGSSVAASYGLRLPEELFPAGGEPPWGPYHFDTVTPAAQVRAREDARREHAIGLAQQEPPHLTQAQIRSHTAPGDISLDDAGQFIFEGAIYDRQEYRVDGRDLLHISEYGPTNGTSAPDKASKNDQTAASVAPDGIPSPPSLRDQAQAHVQKNRPAPPRDPAAEPAPPQQTLGM